MFFAAKTCFFVGFGVVILSVIGWFGTLFRVGWGSKGYVVGIAFGTLGAIVAAGVAAKKDAEEKELQVIVNTSVHVQKGR